MEQRKMEGRKLLKLSKNIQKVKDLIKIIFFKLNSSQQFSYFPKILLNSSQVLNFFLCK